MSEVPNPGSREAKEAGCICPVLDNSYGGGYMYGVMTPRGDPMFVITMGCPLHKPTEEGTDDDAG